MTVLYPGRPAYMEIDLAAARHNVALVRRLIAPSTLLMAAVKADAYGHGAVEIAKTILKAGVQRLAVSNIEEAQELRQAGIGAPILNLGWTAPEQIDLALRYNVQMTVFDYDNARQISAAALAKHKTATIHIKLDTGMGRLGLTSLPPDIPSLSAIIALPGLEAEGIYSHFAMADAREQSYTQGQFRRFQHFLQLAERQGIRLPLRHIANGPAILDFPDAHLDMVRTGILLYGALPSAQVREALPLQPVMRVCARISQIHELNPGDCVGYGCTWQAERPSRIATLPLGYADGLPRLLANKAEVLIGGKRARLVGSICMDQMMADITDIPQAKPGDNAVIVGAQEQQRITLDELARHAQTISYEICTRLGQRLPRVFLNP